MVDVVFPLDVMRVVGRRQTQPQLARDLDQARIHLFLLGQGVVHYLYKEIAVAEDGHTRAAAAALVIVG